MKSIIFFFLTLTCLFLNGESSSLFAQDKYAYVSSQVGLGIQVSPSVQKSAVYGWKAGLFLNEAWNISFLWQLTFDALQSSRSGIGLEYLVLPHGIMTPYVGADLIYQYKPTSQLGARLSLGVEANLKTVTGMDNLRVRTEVAFTELFEKELLGANSRLDLGSVSLAWHF